MDVEKIAKVAHEVNKAYCESIGDHSQNSWEYCSDEIKSSAIDGVKYHLENLDSKPSSSHENWMKFKLENGWTYGEVKDESLKTHPCLVPYDELPKEQRTKDYLFKQIVDSLK